MFKNRLFYSVFFIAATAFLFAYKSKLSSVIFLFALILPIICWMLALISRLLLKVTVEYDKLVAAKYEDIRIRVKLKNRFFIPLSPCAVIGTFPLKGKGVVCRQKIFAAVPPFSSAYIDFDCFVKFRGIYKCGIESVEVYDMLRLSTFRIRVKDYSELVIQPRKIFVQAVPDSGDGDSETISHNRFALDKNSFVNIREYRQGDSIKHVHWAMSAKYDSLMVKQMEQSVGGSGIVIADFNEYFPFDEDNAEASDCIAETLLAINLMLNSYKLSCTSVWYSPDDSQCRIFTVRSEEDYCILFDMMCRLPRQNEVFLPETVARSLKEADNDASCVYFITSQLRRDFITEMSRIDAFRNKLIRVLLIASPIETEEQKKLADDISAARGIELWKIDENNIGQSFINNIEMYNKH